MDIGTLFERLEVVELRAAHYYGGLRRLYCHDLEAASLFYRMELDERKHASLVRLLGRLSNQATLFVRRDLLEGGIIAATLLAFDQACEAKPGTTLADSFAEAWRLENSLGEAYQVMKLSSVVPALRKLIDNLMDEGHVGRLESFGLKRGYLDVASPAQPQHITANA